MKPKFALDLSHEGINLLHRRKGGWSLVGSVDLDDPEMSAHLADLRRRAAALESGGLTCKIIIPNSQVLYTTLEAPGPDDIAREVQIRSGLDGLTPYPVGELVFDWRAAGERARVAVLARETMDEAETFAAEHRFNPVSFVARPPAGEFSGEPFFGKTRAATKILGPTERVEPDASPVPRKPAAMDPTPAPSPAPPPRAAPAMGQAQEPDDDPAPHSPGELAWHPAADPAPAPPAPSASPASPRGSTPDPDIEPETPAAPVRPDPGDDPFAELDAIQAELSGDLSATPSFRSRAGRPQTRPPRSTSADDQPVAPPLAPFPPTSDDADAMPTPPATGPAPGKTRPQPTPAAGEKPGGQGAAPRGAQDRQSPDTAAPGKEPSRPPSKPGPDDDTPAPPGVAFSTRRNGGHRTTTATPTARAASADTDRDANTPTESQPASTASAPPPQRQPRKEGSTTDRRRADMADALSRPLPSGNGTIGKGPKAPEKPAGRSLSEAVRGAAGGLRSFGQKRAPGPAEDARDETKKDSPEKPSDSSMTALMRGAGSREARISPDQYADEPDLLAPDVAAKETADTSPPAASPTTPAKGDTDKPAAAGAPAKSAKAAPFSPQAPAKPASPATSKPELRPAQGAPSPAVPAPDAAARKARAPELAPATAPPLPKPPTNEAEALTVFGARRMEEKRSGRKYLGLLLTLLLLLAMAIIGMWSSFFVDETDPAQFNPDGDATAPAEPEPAPGTENTTSDDTGTDAGDAPTGDTAPATPDSDTIGDADTAPTPQVLSQDEAESLYAESQIWQRAPETLGEPFTPALELSPVEGPDAPGNTPDAPEVAAAPAQPTAPGGAGERAAPLPPPPADTVFDLDDNGLVAPSPDGTVSPTGIIVFEGAPAAVPPARPTPPALPEATPEDATPEDATLDDAALEQAVEQAVEAAAALTEGAPAADLPDVRPEPRPEDLPAPAEPDTTTPEAPASDTGAALSTDPTDGAVTTVAADAASIEAAVDAVATSFVNATDLAVATSVKPNKRPADIDQIVRAAMARAAEAPAATSAAAAAPATTTPAIPTSASVANQATTPNAINLREINLLGISGPTNARRALVRMENGRYVTVKVGDRLDGGRVTSITSDGLTYQKGSRNYTLQLLPLG